MSSFPAAGTQNEIKTFQKTVGWTGVELLVNCRKDTLHKPLQGEISLKSTWNHIDLGPKC